MKNKILKKIRNKRSIYSLSFMYFFIMSVAVVFFILMVQFIVAIAFNDGQNRRIADVFSNAESLAQNINYEFKIFEQEFNDKHTTNKSLDNFVAEAKRIADEYKCDTELYVFSYKYDEDTPEMDLGNVLTNNEGFRVYNNNGYFNSSRSLLYRADTEIFVRNQSDDTTSRIFSMYAYNYNLNYERGVFSFSNTDFGGVGTVTRIYGAYLAKIESSFTPARHVAFYMRVSVTEEELGSTSMIISAVFGALGSLLLSLLLSVYLSKKISHPIKEYADAAQKLGQGDYRQKININDKMLSELKQLGIVFNQAAEEIEKTDSQRKEFLANVTHDLRTPLTMIRAYAEMIRDLSGNNPVKRNAHAQIIIDEADRLSLLVEDILNVSKLEAGTLKMEFSSTNITTLCQTALTLYTIKTEKDGYHILSELDDDAYAVADPQRITQVIHNLVQNAVNYTGEDKTVKVRLKKLDNGVRVEVSDSGRGIAPEEIKNVWTRYYQINQKKRNKMGSGLGLDIVRGILTAHNAKFGVDSELGHGATFWFELGNTLPDKDENGDSHD